MFDTLYNLKDAFNTADKDQSGFIEKGELKDVLKDVMGICAGTLSLPCALSRPRFTHSLSLCSLFVCSHSAPCLSLSALCSHSAPCLSLSLSLSLCPVADDQIDELMFEFDLNRDGKLAYNEFVRCIQVE
jgi:hypothetical protein